MQVTKVIPQRKVHHRSGRVVKQLKRVMFLRESADSVSGEHDLIPRIMKKHNKMKMQNFNGKHSLLFVRSI